MRARIPYLARLAQQAVQPAALRPPHQLFVSGTYSPVRWSGRGGTRPRGTQGGEPAGPAAVETAGDDFALPGSDPAPRAPELIALPPGDNPGMEQPDGDSGPGVSGRLAPGVSGRLAPAVARAAVTAGAPAVPVPSAAHGAHAGLPAPPSAATTRAGVPGVPDAPVRQLAAPGTRAELPGITPAAPVAQADASLAEQMTAPLAPGEPLPAASATQARPWLSALWAGPVELPQTALPSSRPAAPGPGPAPERADGPVPGQPAGTPMAPATPRRADADRPQWRVPGQPAPSAPTASGRLLPPAPVPGPVADFGPGPAGSQQSVPARPRVSIGTIEVTVVPPTSHASGTAEILPPAQAAHGPSRPGRQTAGDGGLRNGLRRWYGIAQG